MPFSRPILLLTFGITLLLGTAPIAAQEEVVISFGEDGMELSTAIQRASEDTGRSFLFGNPRALNQKKIFLAGVYHVPKAKVYEFWQGVFVTQGFAVIPMGPGDQPYLLVEPIQTSKVLIQRGRYVKESELLGMRRQAGEVVMTTLALHHMDTNQVRAAVTPLLANRKTEFIQAVPSANVVIVVGFAPTVFAIAQLVRTMDIAPPSFRLNLERIRLLHADATELQPILTDLLSAARAAEGGEEANRGRNSGTIPGQEVPESKIVADPRTNALLVYAIKKEMDEVKRLVAELDTPQLLSESNIRIYYLRNRNADDLADLLREMVGQSGNRSGAARRPGASRGASRARPGGGNFGGEEIVIVPNLPTNSLLLSCGSKAYEQILPLIEELDQRRPQVMIQAAIVQLNRSDLRQITTELTGVQGGSDYQLGAATAFGFAPIGQRGALTDPTDPGGAGSGTGAGTGTGGGGGNPGGTPDPQATAQADFFDTLSRIPFTGSSPFQGVVAGILQGDFNVPLLIAMLRSKNRGNLVSVPSILTNDNESSRFSVGVEIPIPTRLAVAGGNQGPSSFDYQEAKLELEISPQISDDAYVNLSIQMSVDAFVPNSGVNGAPPTKTILSFDGQVSIPNGKTVVLGGLVQDNRARSESGIPFLMDLPLIGHLFKTQTKGAETKTLYLFITASIFKEFKQLEEVSRAAGLRVAKLGGDLRLIDAGFDLEVEDSVNRLEDLSASGVLDLPSYVPPTTRPSPPSQGQEPSKQSGGSR